MKKDLINDPKEIRKFGIVLALILAFIGFLRWRHGQVILPYSLWSLGGIAGILAIVKPILLRPVLREFLKVAGVLGWVNTRLILILVFYLILMPIGFLVKLFGKDLLDQKLDKKAATYWVPHEAKPAGNKHYERQF